MLIKGQSEGKFTRHILEVIHQIFDMDYVSSQYNL